ncbi:M16 family metallopeptidase [Herbidospora sp. RD11066]
MKTTEIVRATLANGLRVVVEEDHSAPVAAVAVHYGVGFRTETPDRSGLAHLLEHLLFDRDGVTRPDYTAFAATTTDPARLIAREAARMRAPWLSERAVIAQTAVIRDEILRTWRPFAPPRLASVLFGTFANAHDGYGDHLALERVTVDECADFFDRHYAPGNAVVTVVGDVAAGEVLDQVAGTFGEIPRRPVSRPVSLREPEPGVRAVTYTDPKAVLPALVVGYRAPAEPPAQVALAALAGLLSVPARMGRFGPLDARDPDMWIATLPEQGLAAFDDELESIGLFGPSDDRLRIGRSVEDHEHRARTLGRDELLWGDPGLTARLPGLFADLTAADVAAAARSLRPDSRALLTVLPPG